MIEQIFHFGLERLKNMSSANELVVKTWAVLWQYLGKVPNN